MSLFLIFLTGLTTGGLSCLAVQGGLLSGLISNNQKSKQISRAEKLRQTQQILVGFLGAKLVSHALLGLLLGWLGSVFSLSLSAKLFFQAAAGLFMFATAMNLLEVHPVFRHVMLQPPKFVARRLRRLSKDGESWFAPISLGLFTVFIPCGVTQAMEVLAITSGSPIQGMLIMTAFTLGTFPIFSIIGGLTSTLAGVWQRRFSLTAATILIFLSISSLNGVLVVLDSPLTLQKLTRPVTYFFSEERFNQIAGVSTDIVEVENGQQNVVIDILDQGYSPNNVTVKAGVPVKLTLRSNKVYSCALAFTLREFGISTFLKSTDQQSFTFTPEKPGRYTFACSMGMYTGTLKVI